MFCVHVQVIDHLNRTDARHKNTAKYKLSRQEVSYLNTLYYTFSYKLRNVQNVKNKNTTELMLIIVLPAWPGVSATFSVRETKKSRYKSSDHQSVLMSAF